MKFYKTIIIAVLMAVFAGCRTTRPLPVSGGYTFPHEGEEYQLSSMNPEARVGYNLLLKRNGDVIVFQAIDKNQDGVLDEILRGDLTLEQAQAIYAAGLETGRKRGSVRNQTAKVPQYFVSYVSSSYVIQSYIFAVGDMLNRFTIFPQHNENNPIVILDNGADGLLDQVQGDIDVDPDSYQQIYTRILERGVSEGKIAHNQGSYLVVK